MDDGGDVVAGCDLGGSGGDGRVAAQFTFDAYGDVLTADHLHAHAHLRCGHKGLFVDRLDVGVVTTSGVEQPRLVPSGHLLVHNRNRTYILQMGRFLQQDPNATAAVLMESAASHGRGMAAMAAAFSMEQRYGDGGNLYEYLGSSPWQRSDPMGLSWDPFSMVDDFQNAIAGERAALLSQLGAAAQAIAVVAATIATYLPFPGAAIAGEMALAAIGGQSWDTALVAASVGLLPGSKILSFISKPMSMLTSAIGQIGTAAFGAATYYASKFTGWLANKAQGLYAAASALVNPVVKAIRTVRHHLLPRAFAAKFQAAGINIEDYVVSVDADWHKAIHAGRLANGRLNGGTWNELWKTFWDAYPNPRPGNPSVERVESFLNSMKGIFNASHYIVP